MDENTIVVLVWCALQLLFYIPILLIVAFNNEDEWLFTTTDQSLRMGIVISIPAVMVSFLIAYVTSSIFVLCGTSLAIGMGSVFIALYFFNRSMDKKAANEILKEKMASERVVREEFIDVKYDDDSRFKPHDKEAIKQFHETNKKGKRSIR